MEIRFVNVSKPTRSGFKHITNVYLDGDFIHTQTAHYLNRTWESYRFQSVMKQAMRSLIEEEKLAMRNAYKAETGKKRLPKEMTFTNEKIEAYKYKLLEL